MSTHKNILPVDSLKYEWQNDASFNKTTDNLRFTNNKSDLIAPDGKRILRLHAVLPVLSDANSVLSIKTIHNRIIVYIDGKKVFENGKIDPKSFSPTEHIWNRVTLLNEYSNKNVDIYMDSAEVSRFSIYLSDMANVNEVIHTENMVVTIFCLALFGIGALLIVLSFLNIVFKKLWILLFEGLAFGLLAMGVFGNMADGFLPYFLNTYFIYKLSVYAIFSVPIFITALIIGIIGEKRKLLKASMIINIILFIAAISFDLVFSFPIYKIVFGFYFAVLLPVLLNIISLIGLINNKTKRAGYIFIFYLVYTFSFIYNIIFLLFKWTYFYEQVNLISSFALLLILFFAFVGKFIDMNVRATEIIKQTKKNTTWIERVVDVSAAVFSQQTIDSFCTETAINIKKLIEFDRKDENYVAEVPGDGIEKISMTVVLKEDDDFKIIFQDGNIEKFNIHVIEKNVQLAKNEYVVFGNHFLDIYFFSSEAMISLIHFEGFIYGFSENIKNIIRITYSSLSVALINLRLQEDMKQTQERLIYNFSDISEAKSQETGQHVKRIAECVNVICKGMGMTKEECSIVSEAAMMHDVGKLAIPEEIISKDGQLTTAEFEVIMRHTQFGFNMLAKSRGDIMQAAAVIAQQHHEKWDGTGYMGLAGEEIHLYGRIVAVADVFDALLSKRSYKRAWTEAEVYKYMNDKSGTHFDPLVIRAFNENFHELVSVFNKFAENN